MEQKLQALEQRIDQMQQLVGDSLNLMQAIKTRLDDESRCFRTRAIEVVDAAGRPMVSIRANDSGGAFEILTGSGDEAIGMGVQENGCGVLVVRDPLSARPASGVALAGLHIQDGGGELFTMSTSGRTCAVGTGRSARRD